MNRYFIYILLAACTCALSCTGGGSYSNSADRSKQEIYQASGTHLLDMPVWQYRNFTEEDSRGKIYGNHVIDQTLLSKQIAQVLKDNGLEVIPAVKFRLERPPCLLVVSKRERIQYYDRVLLSPDITTEEMAVIESRIDQLDLSSLVVEIGGLGAAYPAIVSPDLAPRQLINAAVEEWAHHFLALRPLGMLYLLDCLGIRQQSDIIVMNETLAGMIADEIGGQVYDRYYKAANQQVSRSPAQKIDFAAEMRETRRTVDLLLNAGEIVAAEQYMEQRKEFFNRHGYSIRKLNQAYFAFHGIYGDDPGAVSPVHDDLVRLRQGYKTLAGFVNDVSGMTGYAQLKQACY